MDTLLGRIWVTLWPANVNPMHVSQDVNLNKNL
jgi:hypothetical protein